MTEQINVKAAGEVQIDDVALLVKLAEDKGAVDAEIDLRYVFAEINIYEDLFSNAIYGNILIGDSNNLLDQLSIQGLEGLRIGFRTPGLSDKQTISKTFGIYSISDQQVLNNDRYQSYRLHFCSLELLGDALNKPLNRPFPAKDDNVAPLQQELIPFIFNKYLVGQGANQIARNLLFKDGQMTKQGVSDLILGVAPYDYTENKKFKNYSNVYTETSSQDSTGGVDAGSATGSYKIQFIAPNWTPLKCINWVANRSVPVDQAQGGSFLFYESNKAFHFASIDALIDKGRDGTGKIFQYEYDPSNLANSPTEQGYSLDVAGEYARVLKLQVDNNFNILDNVNMGMFGAQLRSVDAVLKRYREHDWSFEDQFDKMSHTVNNAFKKAYPMLPKGPNKLLGRDKTLIDPRRNIYTRFRQPFFLFDNELEPLSTHPQWLMQRTSRIASISNFRLQILVNGRTDIKVGDCLNFKFPSLRGEKDDPTTNQDKFFNGLFLITAIKHFISPVKHTMTLEIIKDGLENLPNTLDDTSPELQWMINP